jgi:hypothetical protein
VDHSTQNRGLGSLLLDDSHRRIAEREGRLIIVETSGRERYDPTAPSTKTRLRPLRPMQRLLRPRRRQDHLHPIPHKRPAGGKGDRFVLLISHISCLYSCSLSTFHTAYFSHLDSHFLPCFIPKTIGAPGVSPRPRSQSALFMGALAYYGL